MQMSPEKMTPAKMADATKSGKRRILEALDYANALATDPDAEKRRAACKCLVCFYRPKFYARVGGAACTTKPCMCCHEPMHFGSTITASLCHSCAQLTGLCTDCGADVELHLRATWPTPKPLEPKDADDR